VKEAPNGRILIFVKGRATGCIISLFIEGQNNYLIPHV
jgi:hypothetical protein